MKVTATGKQRAPLFDRLGGVPAVRATITDFYDRIMADERLAYFFDGANMPNLKMHQLRFFKLALTEIPKDFDVPALILEKHLRLFQDKGLCEDHFDIVAGHLVDSLQSLGVPQDLVDETVAIVGPLRAVFVEGAQKHGSSKKVIEAFLDTGEIKESHDRVTGLQPSVVKAGESPGSVTSDDTSDPAQGLVAPKRGSLGRKPSFRSKGFAKRFLASFARKK